MDFLGNFLEGVCMEGRSGIWCQRAEGDGPSTRQGSGRRSAALCFPKGFFGFFGLGDEELSLEKVVAKF